MVITTSTVTIEQRRKHVRDLADITSVTINDADLDDRIDNWDEVAKTYFQVQHLTLDGTESYFRNLLTVAGLLASVAIRQSIGGRDNIDIAKDQKELAKSIVNAQNDKEAEQGTEILIKTSGVDTVNDRGDFV